MDDTISAIFTWLCGVNPVYAGLALVAWYLFGNKITALLSKIPLPKLSKPAPAPDVPAVPADPLESHPLLDVLWKKLKDVWASAPPGTSETDLLVKLLKALEGKQ